MPATVGLNSPSSSGEAMASFCARASRSSRALGVRSDDQSRVEVLERGVRDDLFIETDQPFLGPLPEQAVQILRLEAALRTPHAPQIPAGTLMNEKALHDFHPENRLRATGGFRQLVPIDIGVERRFYGVAHDFGDMPAPGLPARPGGMPAICRVSSTPSTRVPPRPLANAASSSANSSGPGSPDFPAGKGHLLELDGAVLAEPDPLQEPFG